MVADFLSGWFVNFLYGGGFSQTGQHPDYRYAKNHRRDGERKEAVAAIQTELRKDPKNFEGLLMLAEIYEDLNQPAEAIAQLNIILENPDATPEQKEVAEHECENCRRLQKHLEEAEFFKQQNRR
jgi:predicted Zn-dependent protease